MSAGHWPFAFGAFAVDDALADATGCEDASALATGGASIGVTVGAAYEAAGGGGPLLSRGAAAEHATATAERATA